jgi:hypothetical protein
MFFTVSLITSTSPLLNSDFAFSSLSANTMNNRHQSQPVINSVSWMKATEMGLITLSMCRPVNMCKSWGSVGTFSKNKFDYKFQLQGHFGSNYKLRKSFCLQVILKAGVLVKKSWDINTVNSFLNGDNAWRKRRYTHLCRFSQLTMITMNDMVFYHFGRAHLS